MTERTLSRLIVASFVTAIIAYSAMRSEILDGVLPRGFFQVVFMTAFGAAPCLIILKAISRLFLLALKDQPLSFLEPLFSIYYVVLTKEARAEWRVHIEERKNRGLCISITAHTGQPLAPLFAAHYGLADRTCWNNP